MGVPSVGWHSRAVPSGQESQPTAPIVAVIIADNVVRGGAVLDLRNNDPNVQGVRRFYEMLSRESRVRATAIQTVGAKGYDGFAIARVVA